MEIRVVPIGGRGMDCNQFLIKDAKSNQFDLIDAGLGTDFDHVLGQVAAVIDPSRVQSVAITHEHLDHVNGLPAWQKLGAKIATSAPTAEKLRVGHDPTSAMFGQAIPTLEVDLVLEDETDLNLGGDPHRCLATPGHSPGSMCFWHEPSRTLYSGDTVFAQGGIGRFDFPDSNLGELAESILRLEKLPVRMLHCGHGPSVEGAHAAASVKSSVGHVQSCLQGA